VGQREEWDRERGVGQRNSSTQYLILKALVIQIIKHLIVQDSININTIQLR
jgi:hypothetical protein